MAMTPEERNKMDKLERQVEALSKVQDVPFIENIKRRLDIVSEVAKQISSTNIGDLANVDDAGITNNQLLKWNSSNSQYEPANDIDT